MMPWQAWVTLLVIVCTFVLLFTEKGAPDQLMLGAVVVVWALGIISAKEAIAGFSNAGLVTVGALFIVVQAVDKSKLLERLAKKLVGRKSGEFMARVRLCLTGFCASGFLNNTPLVALLLPIIRDWARGRGFAASKFLIPLSYSTIMGGLLTIIGTSTNLLVTGLMEARGLEPFGFFAPAVVAFPVGLVGLLYLLFLAPYLLPGDRGGLFRLLREKGEDLITQVVLTNEFPHLGKNFSDILSLLSIPEDCLLEVLRPRTYVHAEGPSNPGLQLSADSSASIGADDNVGEQVPLFGNDFHVGRRHVFWGCVRAAAEAMEDADETDLQETEEEEEAWKVEQLWGFTPEECRRPGTEFGGSKGLAQICRGTSAELSTRHARAGDILVLLMSREDLVALVAQQRGLHIQSLLPSQVTGEGTEFVEVVLAGPSPLIGLDIARAPQHVQRIYGVPLVAVRPRGGGDSEETLLPVKNFGSKQLSPNKSSKRMTQSLEEEAETGGPVAADETVTSAGYNANKTFALGDTLLLLAPDSAKLPQQDFYVVSKVGALPSPPSWYDYVPLVLFVLGLALAAFEVVPMVQVAVTLAAIFTLGHWISARELRQIVDWNLLILIGAALGFSAAVSESGLSAGIAGLVKGAGLGPQGSICLLFLATMVTTEVITNNAAAALGLPLALDIADALNLSSPRPLIMTVMLAASTSYAIPIGYATNLMVMGPGGYTFIDFLKVGVPMDLIYWVGCTLLLPVFFPVHVITEVPSNVTNTSYVPLNETNATSVAYMSTTLMIRT